MRIEKWYTRMRRQFDGGENGQKWMNISSYRRRCRSYLGFTTPGTHPRRQNDGEAIVYVAHHFQWRSLQVRFVRFFSRAIPFDYSELCTKLSSNSCGIDVSTELPCIRAGSFPFTSFMRHLKNSPKFYNACTICFVWFLIVLMVV